jgi:peroxiredoxin
MKPILTFCLLLLMHVGHGQSPKFKTGDQAPAFSGRDQNGKMIRLADLKGKEQVVLLFYRGYWCPYCNKQLHNLQDSLAQYLAKNATVIAVTPESPANVQKTISKTEANFSIIADNTQEIMNAYGVSFKVDATASNRLKSIGVDLKEVNGNHQDILPVPAVYIIGLDGRFKYVYFNTNYRYRPSNAELLEQL